LPVILAVIDVVLTVVVLAIVVVLAHCCCCPCPLSSSSLPFLPLPLLVDCCLSPTIAIAADVFIVAATPPATATTAAAVAGIIARRYRHQHYCCYCHHGEFLRDRHDTDSMVSVIFYTANDLYQYWCQVGINQE
jgi:hypothetical protein